jgi:uncharacterized protein YggE
MGVVYAIKGINTIYAFYGINMQYAYSAYRASNPFHVIGPDVKGAGAVIDLAVALDADEYPRPVQQQRLSMR